MQIHPAIAFQIRVALSLTLLFVSGHAVFAGPPSESSAAKDLEPMLQSKLERLSRLDRSSGEPFDRFLVHAETESAVPRHPAPPFQEFVVDCDAGASVNRYLNGARARKVILRLLGTCRESVVVTRPGVTLSGAGTAVIDPPDDRDGVPIGPAVYAMAAHGLTLEDLTLRGGSHGLEAHATHDLRLTRMTVVENTTCSDCAWSQGVYLDASHALITDSTLSNNFAPLWVDRHSHAVVLDTLIENNTGDAPFASFHSHLELRRCQLTGNGFAPQAYGYSNTWIYDSVVESPGYEGWSAAWLTGDLRIFRTEIHGGIYGAGGSQVRLNGVQFGTGSPNDAVHIEENTDLFIADSRLDDEPVIGAIHGEIRLWSFSTVTIRGEGAVHGSVFLDSFSDADLVTESPIQGSVDCGARSRAHCIPEPTEGMWGCE